jgi:hypothetical protein
VAKASDRANKGTLASDLVIGTFGGTEELKLLVFFTKDEQPITYVVKKKDAVKSKEMDNVIKTVKKEGFGYIVANIVVEIPNCISRIIFKQKVKSSKVAQCGNLEGVIESAVINKPLESVFEKIIPYLKLDPKQWLSKPDIKLKENDFPLGKAIGKITTVMGYVQALKSFSEDLNKSYNNIPFDHLWYLFVLSAGDFMMECSTAVMHINIDKLPDLTFEQLLELADISGRLYHKGVLVIARDQLKRVMEAFFTLAMAIMP